MSYLPIENDDVYRVALWYTCDTQAQDSDDIDGPAIREANGLLHRFERENAHTARRFYARMTGSDRIVANIWMRETVERMRNKLQIATQFTLRCARTDGVRNWLWRLRRVR